MPVDLAPARSLVNNSAIRTLGFHFYFLTATPAAYGNSQARGWMGAAAAA